MRAEPRALRELRRDTERGAVERDELTLEIFRCERSLGDDVGSQVGHETLERREDPFGVLRSEPIPIDATAADHPGEVD